MTEAFEEAPESTTEVEEAGGGQKARTANVVMEAKSDSATSTHTSPPKKGVVGERSHLAKGSGPVWEIRQALGRERLHGLGWTREHLAFVLKLSVVGVRKLEHTGAAPVKSKVAREQLLELAKSIKEPTPEILAYIQSEEAR